MLENEFFAFRSEIIKKMEFLLDDAILQVSSSLNAIIVTKEINSYSLYCLFQGSEPKPYYITQRTEKEGIAAGFILETEQAIPLHINFNDKKYYINQNQFKKTLDIENVTKALMLNGKYVTSDLDIAMILHSSNTEEPFFDKELGYVNGFEINIINQINKTFKENVVKEFAFHKSTELKIVTHGSFNLYPKSNMNFISPNLDIYYSNKDKKKLTTKEQIQEFLKVLHSKKYKLNKNWE